MADYVLILDDSNCLAEAVAAATATAESIACCWSGVIMNRSCG